MAWANVAWANVAWANVAWVDVAWVDVAWVDVAWVDVESRAPFATCYTQGMAMAGRWISVAMLGAIACGGRAQSRGSDTSADEGSPNTEAQATDAASADGSVAPTGGARSDVIRRRIGGPKVLP